MLEGGKVGLETEAGKVRELDRALLDLREGEGVAQWIWVDVDFAEAVAADRGQKVERNREPDTAAEPVRGVADVCVRCSPSDRDTTGDAAPLACIGLDVRASSSAPANLYAECDVDGFQRSQSRVLLRERPR